MERGQENVPYPPQHVIAFIYLCLTIFNQTTGLHQKRVYTSLGTSFLWTPIVVCSCMYTFLWKQDPMRTPSHIGVRIGSHFNKNAYTSIHEQTTIEFGVRIMGRNNLNWCTPFFAVSLWTGLHQTGKGVGQFLIPPVPWIMHAYIILMYTWQTILSLC